LGPISFNGLAYPSRIVIKNRQRNVVHQLGSGSLATDSLGDDLQSVSFKGIFTGQDATTRARLLDSLRSQGALLRLSWESIQLTVLIHELDFIYSSNLWITYSLSCNVVQTANADGPGATDPILASAAAQVSDIQSIIQKTPVVMTADQETALTILANMQFDSPPPGALSSALGLISSIRSSIDTLASQLRDPTLNNPAIGAATKLTILDVTAYFGQLSLLTIAENRVLSIVSDARGVGGE